jgi:hypothetical protein
MKRLALTLIILVFSSTALGQEDPWSKYIPQKQRKSLIKNYLRTTGIGGVISQKAAIAIWVTDEAARILVSQAIDRERLTNEQADALFSQLRPEDSFLVLIHAKYLNVRRFPEELPDPLSKNEIFLQRAEDEKQFSKGVVQDEDFNIHLGKLLLTEYELVPTQRVLFPKQTRSNEKLVRSLDDKIELRFIHSGKKIVFRYKLKDGARNLEDL